MPDRQQASICKTKNRPDEAARWKTPESIGEPRYTAPASRPSPLNRSNDCIAIFDEGLQFRALGGAPAWTRGFSVNACIGKSVRELFDREWPKIETGLKQALATGKCVTNGDLNAELFGVGGVKRWGISFYPVRSKMPNQPYVAVAFSELTQESILGQVLTQLEELRRAMEPDDSSGPREEFGELAARSRKLIQDSIGMLKRCAGEGSGPAEIRSEPKTNLAESFPQVLPLHGLNEGASLAQSTSGACMMGPVPAPLGRVSLRSRPSSRERQILHLLTHGKSNKQIGQILSLSTRTVETYRARVMVKLDLHSTAELVRYAIRNRIADV